MEETKMLEILEKLAFIISKNDFQLAKQMLKQEIENLKNNTIV